MARPFEKGIPALYKYQGVKYFYFDVPPGASYVLTADPWSFLKTWLMRVPDPHRREGVKEDEDKDSIRGGLWGAGEQGD
jgi:hypothetical protein